MPFPLLALGIASLVSSIAGQGMSYASQKGDVARQKAQQATFIHNNKVAAAEGVNRGLEDLSQQEIEQYIAASYQKQNLMREKEIAVATSRVAAAESGVAGNSVDAAIRDIELQGAESADAVDLNVSFIANQIRREKAAVIARGKNQVNQVQNVEYRGPSVATPLLGIASAGLSFIDYFQNKRDAVTQMNNRNYLNSKAKVSELTIPIGD